MRWTIFSEVSPIKPEDVLKRSFQAISFYSISWVRKNVNSLSLPVSPQVEKLKKRNISVIAVDTAYNVDETHLETLSTYKSFVLKNLSTESMNGLINDLDKAVKDLQCGGNCHYFFLAYLFVGSKVSLVYKKKVPKYRYTAEQTPVYLKCRPVLLFSVHIDSENRQRDTGEAEIKVPSSENSELPNVLALKPRVGQNTADTCAVFEACLALPEYTPCMSGGPYEL